MKKAKRCTLYAVRNTKRPTWDDYFLDIANLVSTRSTCLRRRVGAVLVKDKRILASGYNGAPSSIEHCSVTGCIRDKLKIPSGERHELCLPPNEEVFTDAGYIPISDVKLGQKVLTHKGIYRRVVKVYKRKYNGELCYVEPWHLLPVSLTPSHPVLAIQTVRCEFDKRTLCKETCRSVNKAYCGKPFLKYRAEWIPAGELKEKDIVHLPFDNRTVLIDKLDLSFVKDAPSSYYEVLSRREEGKSYGEIKGELGVWSSTAFNWTRGGAPRNRIVICEDDRLKHGSRPSKKINSEIRLTNAVLRLIGFYLAEGSSSANQLCFSFHKKETQYLEEIRKTMREEFDLVPYEYIRRNSHKLVYSSVILARAFKEMFGRDAYTKHLPHFLLRLPREKQREILAAYIQGDGYRVDENTTTATTASISLALQAIQILLRSGYNPIIDEDRGKYRIMWRNKIKIPYGYIKGDIFFNPIRKIRKETYSGFVHNLEVEEDHSYVTRSFVVHNCRGLHAEQNAFLQAALHGTSLKDAILYSTTQPCIICAKMIINAGIREIVYRGVYPDKMAADFLKAAGIKLRIVR